MYSIICATDRPGNKSREIGKFYYDNLLSKTTKLVKMLSLEDLQRDLIQPGIFTAEQVSDDLAKVQDEYFVEPDKWILIIPEYNGGIPGVLKLLIDSMSNRKYAETFEDKKICLVGVSSGRAGNLRGMDYITNVFHYLKANVFPIKLPISGVETLLNKKGEIKDQTIKQSILDQLDKFINY